MEWTKSNRASSGSLLDHAINDRETILEKGASQ
jgi:hypothetical protein